MKRTTIWLTVFLISMLTFATARAADSVQLEETLPPDALALVSCRDVNGSWKRFKNTALYHIWEEPEVQTFLEPVIKRLNRELQQARKRTRERDGIVAGAADLLDVVPGHVAVALLPPSARSQRPIPTMVALVEAHKNIDKIRSVVDMAVKKAEKNPRVQIKKPFSHENVEVHHITAMSVSIFYAFDGQRFLLATSEKTMTEVLDGLKKRSARSGQTLAHAPALTSVTRRLGQARETTILLNIDAVYKNYEPILRGMAPPKVMAALDKMHIKKIKNIVMASAIEPPGIRDVVYLHAPGKREGLVKLLEHPMGRKELLQHVPGDALLCWASKMNIKQSYTTLMNLVQEISPPANKELQKQITAVENELDISIEKDLINALGDEASLYYRFPAEMALTFRVQNPDGIARTMRSILNRAAEEAPPRGRTGKQLAFQDHTVHYVPIRTEDVVLWPAYAVTEDTCVLALNPQTVKSVLARLTSTTGPDSPGHSIVASSRFQKAVRHLPGEHVSVTYVDLPAMVEPAYNVAGLVMQWASNDPDFRRFMHKSGIDPGKLPRKEVISRHLFPAVESYSVDKNGFWTESYSPIGSRASLLNGLSTTTSLVLPAVVKARERAHSVSSMSNLRQIFITIQMYIRDHDGKMPPHDTFPEALDDYLDSKKLFYHPSNDDAVENYPENIDYVYSPHLPEKAAAMTSKTPVMWEKRAFNSNGSRNVLFRDGHVEKLSRQEFKKLIQKAKKKQKKN